MTATVRAIVRCDATYDRDDAGRVGYFTAIVEGGTESVSVGACSDDRVQIWHGMDSPAIACGKHATAGIGHGPSFSVFRGHRNRVAEASRCAGCFQVGHHLPACPTGANGTPDYR